MEAKIILWHLNIHTCDSLAHSTPEKMKISKPDLFQLVRTTMSLKRLWTLMDSDFVVSFVTKVTLHYCNAWSQYFNRTGTQPVQTEAHLLKIPRSIMDPYPCICRFCDCTDCHHCFKLWMIWNFIRKCVAHTQRCLFFVPPQNH